MRSRSYHDFFLCHELENYRISFYHTEGHGIIFVTNLRISEFPFSHTENHGIIFVTNLRICEIFLLITRRITEYHGIIFVTNLRISELFLIITRRIAEYHGRQKFDNSGQRTSLGTKR